ncbi:hypothetical protein ENSA5_66730 [Enhygromyxa salina]|uniref:Uncharacterized protein n=1 Tax=Enhygromyxa salina TaxID=215803 RepID=A0A2S9XBH8_9BACT|nr:Ig-like domain-containing protein [Enhygromyxa salina]PRP90212.1 hypothetical protein ENSA5_66730 [Enhygromyxa salina]
MQKRHLHSLPALLLSLAAGPLACFQGDDLDLDDLAEAETEALDEDGGEDPDEGEHPALEAPAPAEGDTTPELTLLVNGSSTPELVRSATELVMSAEVRDDIGVERVEFYLGEELVETDTEAPYEARLVAPDASFNGAHALVAVAYDEAANTTEDAIELAVEMPETGTLEWVYEGAPGEDWVGVFPGPDGGALVVGRDRLLRVSAEGEALSSWDFPYPISVATADHGGGIIALGANAGTAGTLFFSRFDADGIVTSVQLVPEFGDVEEGFSITDAAVGHNDRLMIAALSSYAGQETARLSSVTNTDEVVEEWHRYQLREGERSLGAPARVAVGPSGEIFMTVEFALDSDSAWGQVRRYGQGGYQHWYSEDAQPKSSGDLALAVNEHGVFAGGRQEGEAAIRKFDELGEQLGLYYLDGEALTAMELIDDELVYVTRGGNSVDGVVGRMSVDGEPRWSVTTDEGLANPSNPEDLAVTRVGHVYVLSELDLGAPRLARFHP